MSMPYMRSSILKESPLISHASRVDFNATIFSGLYIVLLKVSARPLAGAIYIDNLCKHELLVDAELQLVGKRHIVVCE